MEWRLVDKMAHDTRGGVAGDSWREPKLGAQSQRKSDVVCAHWRQSCEGAALPAWSRLARVMNSDLSSYCIIGDLHDVSGAASITGLGRNFASCLENGDGASTMSTSYPAAVLVGVIVSLAGQLRHSWAPVQTAGEFAAEVNSVVRYRAAVLPFRNGARAPKHWLGLASWILLPTRDAAMARH